MLIFQQEHNFFLSFSKQQITYDLKFTPKQQSMKINSTLMGMYYDIS